MIVHRRKEQIMKSGSCPIPSGGNQLWIFSVQDVDAVTCGIPVTGSVVDTRGEGCVSKARRERGTDGRFLVAMPGRRQKTRAEPNRVESGARREINSARRSNRGTWKPAYPDVNIIFAASHLPLSGQT